MLSAPYTTQAEKETVSKDDSFLWPRSKNPVFVHDKFITKMMIGSYVDTLILCEVEVYAGSDAG